MNIGKSLKLRMYEVIWLDPYSSNTLSVLDSIRIPVRDELQWPLNETTWTFFIHNVSGTLGNIIILANEL